MRRPVCFAAVLFVLLMGLSMIAVPPGRDFPEQTDGHIVNLTGRVKWKEYRVRRESGGWGRVKESIGSGTVAESGGPGTAEESGGPGTAEERGRSGTTAEKDTTVLCLIIEDVQIESGLPPGISLALYADDKVRCVLEEDLEGQDRAAGIGNRVRIRGKIAVLSPPTCDGQFDSRFYYQQVQGFLFGLEEARLLSASTEGSVFMNALYRLRGELSRAVDAIYTDPQKASVMKAVLLGQSGLLDPDTKEMYQANGLIHIVCISGLHISLLGMGLFRLLRRIRLPAAAAAPVALAAIVSYGLMTGMHASSFRAVLMFLFHVTAIVIGRTYDLLTALSVSAILLIVENPSVILYSGFQYSFAAVIAAGSMADLLPRGWKFLSVPASILPVQLWHNYTFPVYSVLLNL
ncbi:MAG: ComEC/Rec2 family competence protein, partial [Eubacteriales bacterium]|nr:ComEC/Rec2 family competence protein [Eubacteriales bacterium]